ncbi:Protein of unknown function [Natronincola peptidivorans]|uniref:DUF2953 domain-containing protein n=1 Tax=Natronincola peptidivorans TaxID=426128 RepID=A0A1H9Y571_9FIRM|nr:DUF2953 domain-containing protein [Natronincola peptidivorans]SES63980.1 Protein of unknown function [Natronincola peptidivorans]
MMVLMILKYILLFLLTLLLLLLFVPIHYHASGSKYETVKFQSGISWLWKGLQVNIMKDDAFPPKIMLKLLGIPFSFSLDKEEEKAEEKIKKKSNKKKQESKEKSKSKLKKSPEEWLRLVNRETFTVILASLMKLWFHIKPKALNVKAHYGLDNPCDTAMVLAFFSSLAPLLEGYSIALIPSFEGAVLEGEAQIQGRIVLVLLVMILIKLLLSKPIKKIIKFLIKMKKEEKIYVS